MVGNHQKPIQRSLLSKWLSGVRCAQCLISHLLLKLLLDLCATQHMDPKAPRAVYTPNRFSHHTGHLPPHEAHEPAYLLAPHPFAASRPRSLAASAAQDQDESRRHLRREWPVLVRPSSRSQNTTPLRSRIIGRRCWPIYTGPRAQESFLLVNPKYLLFPKISPFSLSATTRTTTHHHHEHGGFFVVVRLPQ